MNMSASFEAATRQVGFIPAPSHRILPFLSAFHFSYCMSENRVPAPALFKAGGSSPFMPCYEKAQILMLCFHSFSLKRDIKSICGRLPGL